MDAGFLSGKAAVLADTIKRRPSVFLFLIFRFVLFNNAVDGYDYVV